MCGRLMPASFVVMQRPPVVDGASGGAHAGGIAYWDECALGDSGGSTACSNGSRPRRLTSLFAAFSLRATRTRQALAT